MLLEMLEYLVTPCSREARSLGYLSESVAIRARHRRLKAAWRGHLENSRRVVLEQARLCATRDTALIMGSGALLDVPLAELSSLFRRVVLADIVHPLDARLAARRHANVTLIPVDLTGTASAVARGETPRPESPPDLLALSPDLAVSLNVLSQLPLMPVKALRRRGVTETELDAFSRCVVEEHVRFLGGFNGRALLVCDTCWLENDERSDPLGGVRLPPALESWTWDIAPRPETRPDADIRHQVSAFIL